MLLHFYILTFTCISGQNNKESYKGSIIDSQTKQKIEGVVCKAVDANKNIINYCFSNDRGQFNLGHSETIEFLFFESLGYKTVELNIKSITNRNKIEIILEEEGIVLKEITVSVAPIKRSGDTISYNVGSFVGRDDKYLADLLKKLPGINVDKSGTISYQGEAINKFYIEGRDLLGGQYTMATNNLSIDAVSQVQILENNQHIKALKGISFSDKAAINIKLKSSFIAKPFGEVQTGIGFEPILYNEKLFASQIGSKIQSILNFKINNIGENIISEMDEKISIENITSLESQPEQLINPSIMRYLRIPENRYYYNKTILTSLNNLIVLSKNTELKTNFSYANNNLKENIFSKSNYLVGDEDLVIHEQSNLINKDKRFIASATLEHNSEKIFLKNEFKSASNWGKSNASLITNDKNLNTRIENNPTVFRNDFHALFKYEGRKTIQVKSFIQHINRNEFLSAKTPENNALLLDENIEGKYFVFKNKISTAFDFFSNRLDLGLDFNYIQRNIKSDSIIHNIDESLLHNLKFNKINSNNQEIHIGISPTYQIKNKSVITTFEIPFSYRRYNTYKSGIRSTSYDKFIFSPTIKNYFKINNFWELNSRIGSDWKRSTELSLLSNPFFRNYRSVYIPAGTLNFRRSYTGTSRIKYDDLIEMIFFNFQIMYSLDNLNYMPEMFHTEDISYYRTINIGNTTRQLIVNSSFSKTFIPLKLSITFSPSYTLMSSKILQNGNFIHNKGNSLGLSIKTEYKAINNVSLNYNIHSNGVWNDNNLSNKDVLKNFTQNLIVFYFPSKNIDLSLNTEHTLMETEKDKYSNYFFLDVKTKYRLKKIEFSASVSNLFDKDTYSVTYLSTASSLYQHIPLRGREFLFTISAKF
jgi:hypothetical protein